MLQQKFMEEYHERNRARKALKAARKAKAAPQAKKAAATGAPAPPRDDEDDEARRRPPHSPSPCFPKLHKAPWHSAACRTPRARPARRT